MDEEIKRSNQKAREEGEKLEKLVEEMGFRIYPSYCSLDRERWETEARGLHLVFGDVAIFFKKPFHSNLEYNPELPFSWGNTGYVSRFFQIATVSKKNKTIEVYGKHHLLEMQRLALSLELVYDQSMAVKVIAEHERRVEICAPPEPHPM